jgi:hypothetical protein
LQVLRFALGLSTHLFVLACRMENTTKPSTPSWCSHYTCGRSDAPTARQGTDNRSLYRFRFTGTYTRHTADAAFTLGVKMPRRAGRAVDILYTYIYIILYIYIIYMTISILLPEQTFPRNSPQKGLIIHWPGSTWDVGPLGPGPSLGPRSWVYLGPGPLGPGPTQAPGSLGLWDHLGPRFTWSLGPLRLRAYLGPVLTWPSSPL